VIWLLTEIWLWVLVAFVVGALVTWAISGTARRIGPGAAAPGGAAPGRPESADQSADRDDELAGLRSQLRDSERRITALAADLEESERLGTAELNARDREMALLRAKLLIMPTAPDGETTNRPVQHRQDHGSRYQHNTIEFAAPIRAEDGRTPAQVAAPPAVEPAEPAEPAAHPEPAKSAEPAAEHGEPGEELEPAKSAEPAAEHGEPGEELEPAESAEPAESDDLMDLAGVAAPRPDGSAPDGFSIKGRTDDGVYYTPDSPEYGATAAEAWFANEIDARAAGFVRWDEAHTAWSRANHGARAHSSAHANAS
jgi:hypothetical protein